jgi:DNA-binding MarR family transcriptional regulator
MLRRLLTLIAANEGVSSLDELAQEMGVPPAITEQLIGELVRGGYLRTAYGECAPIGCAACPARVSCHPPTGFRLWELTPKGRRLLAESLSSQPITLADR